MHPFSLCLRVCTVVCIVQWHGLYSAHYAWYMLPHVCRCTDIVSDNWCVRQPLLPSCKSICNSITPHALAKRSYRTETCRIMSSRSKQVVSIQHGCKALFIPLYSLQVREQSNANMKCHPWSKRVECKGLACQLKGSPCMPQRQSAPAMTWSSQPLNS